MSSKHSTNFRYCSLRPWIRDRALYSLPAAGIPFPLIVYLSKDRVILRVRILLDALEKKGKTRNSFPSYF